MLNKYPKVSVAIITYNQKDFIKDALDSVFIQNYPNFEICISDDASTDGTDQIIKRYLAEKNECFPNIVCKYLQNERNVGIVQNYNQVLSLCSGDYIAWLDGDDLFLPEKINAQVAFMESHPDCVISHTEVEVFDNTSGKIIFQNSFIKYKRSGNFRTLLQNGTIFANCTTMVRGNWQRKIKFDNEFNVLGDWLNKAELLIESKLLIKYLPQTFSRHRMHGCNNSQQKINGDIGANVEDLINQHIKLINKYPQYTKDILLGLSRVYRSMGKYNNKLFYRTAFYIKPFYWKNFIMHVLSYMK